MTSFSGTPSDLSDAVAYELDVIEYLRTTVHRHCEAPVGGTRLVLGDLTPDGEQRTAALAVGKSDNCGGAVRAALGRLRPLTFFASFKLQDMVVEWILRANGVSCWRFSEKLAAYKKRPTNIWHSGSTWEPTFFWFTVLSEGTAKPPLP